MFKFKYFMILLTMLLCVQTISAELFQFDNAKQYDEETQTVVITNTFGLGRTIADIKLNTPTHVVTGFGDVFKVAEFTINTYDDEYTGALEKIDFINKYTNDKTDRQFIYKLLTYKDVVVYDYPICEGDINKCGESKIIGNHTEQQEEWIDFDYAKLIKGKYTIGIFTYVNKNDYVEWIPTFYGVKIEEWATFSASLKVGCMVYYDFEDAGTTLTDLTGRQDGTAEGDIVTEQAGALGNSWSINPTGVNGKVDITGLTDSVQTYTFSFWVKPTKIKPDVFFSDSASGRMALIMFSPSTGSHIGSYDGVYRDFGGNITLGVWNHIIIITNATGWFSYVNGVWGGTTGDRTAVNIGGATTLTTTSNPFFGLMDEVGWWNRSLTQAEIDFLYGGGTPPFFNLQISNPNVTLMFPANYFNTSNPSITFNASAIEYNDGGIITNVTLYIDGIANVTDTSELNGSYQWIKTFSDGKYNWSVLAFNNNSKSNQSATREFWVNSTPYLVLDNPINYSNLTYNNVGFNATITPTYDLLNVSLYINGIYNYSNTSAINGVYNFTKFLGDGFYNWSIKACSSLGGCNSSEVRNLTIDSIKPSIIIIYPTNTTIYTNYTNADSIEHWFNWTTYDIHPSICWWSNDSGVTNYSITCNANASFNAPYGSETLIAWANDTYLNLNTSRVTALWDWRIFENSRSVPAVVTEGTTQTFTLNISNLNFPLTSAYLNYNGTRKTANINAGTSTILTSSFSIPSVSVDGNATILWELFIAMGGINSTASYINVTNINIDNCTDNHIVLYNFTLKDEITQTKLNGSTDNTSGKINLQIYPYNSHILFANYSTSMLYTNPFYVCINDTLESTDKFTIDAQIEYDALLNAKEYYYFQNDTLNSTYLYKNITLYDLNDSNAQTFLVTYKDSSGIPIEDALIEVHRNYVEEGMFKIVEISKTDTDGKTQAKLQRNDVIYNFIVKKNGVTLNSFNNKFVRCDNYLYDVCEIKLYGFSSYPTTKDYTQGDDFSFTLDFNHTSRTITSSFTIPSGSSAVVVLNATLLDNLGTSVACSDSITSSSGTLTCIVPNSIGNSSIHAQLFKDGVYQAGGIIKLEQSPKDIFGSSLVFLLLFMYLTLIGIAINDNPMVTGLFLIVGAILGVLFNFVDTKTSSFIGAGATILYFIIAVIIMMIKGGKRT